MLFFRAFPRIAKPPTVFLEFRILLFRPRQRQIPFVVESAMWAESRTVEYRVRFRNYQASRFSSTGRAYRFFRTDDFPIITDGLRVTALSASENEKHMIRKTFFFVIFLDRLERKGHRDTAFGTAGIFRKHGACKEFIPSPIGTHDGVDVPLFLDSALRRLLGDQEFVDIARNKALPDVLRRFVVNFPLNFPTIFDRDAIVFELVTFPVFEVNMFHGRMISE
jgi:hypothetical protein